MAQPVVVQPIPDRPAVDAQLAGYLCKRPCPLDHAVGQIRLEAGRASTASPSLGRQRNLSGEAERRFWDLVCFVPPERTCSPRVRLPG